MDSVDWSTDRSKTAIGRASLSMPARQALMDGVLRPGWTALDYGSGRGGDVKRLTHLGIEATAWDPHFGGIRPTVNYDVVAVTYVINVIESLSERKAVLADAWSLTRRCLVVSTRLTWERRQVIGAHLADGTITRRNTFQHLFTPAELRTLVGELTEVRPLSPVPGVVYAFRHPDDRMAYLARRASPGHAWRDTNDQQSALAAVVEFLETRGRLPMVEETPASLLSLLQSITGRQLAKLAAEAADPRRVYDGRKRSILNVLLVLGMDVFNGRSPFTSLPLPIQADIRAFFESYRESIRRADRLLLKLRDDGYLRRVMYNSVGKMTPTAIYIHRRAVDQMPVLLRLYEHCGAVAAGRPHDWDIVKLVHQGRAVSWLGYPDFDRDPHPRLAWSYCVDMHTLDGTYRSYSNNANRPILHRKHEFLPATDPAASKYLRLTQQEIRAGLYKNPHLIGNERGWNDALSMAGVQLRGHRLIRKTRQAKADETTELE